MFDITSLSSLSSVTTQNTSLDVDDFVVVLFVDYYV